MTISNDNKYTGTLGKTLKLDEYSTVEKPFLEQLKTLGWNDGYNEVIELKTLDQTPAQSYRDSYNDVILRPKFREAIKRINPFLTNEQIDEVERRITSSPHSMLIENNKRVLELLQGGCTVSRNESTGEVNPSVQFIDFDNIDNNTFTAISQFKVRVQGDNRYIVPDIVLFVNGLPLVVVECKSAMVTQGLEDAIDQLLRYSEQRGDLQEGNRTLFQYNQIMVITNRVDARFGTITSHVLKHFYQWNDPYPRTLDELEHGAAGPNSQQRLVAGMFDRKNLIDIVRVFTCFISGRVKIVGRYQQFRAVKKAVKRLLEGHNKWERGGIIWHTQGSGKSLTMMFLIREMHIHTQLASWKVVLVTDRTQLQKQLLHTGTDVGYTIRTASRINPGGRRDGNSLKELLANDNSDIVLAMIHKFQERSELESITPFPELNRAENVLILTDEAHRSQYSILAANLDKALPNATSIAFTGTPTDKTEHKYKGYVDKYSMRQSIDDGVTLGIIYEGFTHRADVSDPAAMDREFEDVFNDYNLDERLRILGYFSRDAYLDALPTIEAKATRMVDHYVDNIFSGGFKAQVVANSRLAAVRYKTALEAALRRKILALEISNPYQVDLEVLRKLEVAVVISGENGDSNSIKPYTSTAYHDAVIKSFKTPFDESETGRHKSTDNGNVGIIVVNNMLLTGFDAPIEQVLYIDRVIVGHNLLQAMSRVNRVATDDKNVGFVVDFVGIGHDLKRAIEESDLREERVDRGEIESIISCLASEQHANDALKSAHEAMLAFMRENGVEDLSDIDAIFEMFYDVDVRTRYIELFRTFTARFNDVMPRRIALDYLSDWYTFTRINALALQHVRDRRFSMRDIPQKLLAIADKYLLSQGINPSVAPIPITSSRFTSDAIDARRSARSRAAAIEHAIRDFIEININDDFDEFDSFSQRLREILDQSEGNWTRIVAELEELRRQIVEHEQRENHGLDRRAQMPFFRMLKKEIFGNSTLDEAQTQRMVNLTEAIVSTVASKVYLRGFWEHKTQAQKELRGAINDILLSPEFHTLPGMSEKKDSYVTSVMDLAKRLHQRILEFR